MADKEWDGYMLLGNGWTETISNVTFIHTAGDQTDVISVPSLAAGQVTRVALFKAHSKYSDNWTVSFQTESGSHSATISDAGFKEEDANAILFAQVTKENSRLTLYFPVSSDEYKSI